MKKKNELELAVLTFTRKKAVATIVTDGVHVRSYEPQNVKSHARISHAISYLESRGWSIEMDKFI